MREDSAKPNRQSPIKLALAAGLTVVFLVVVVVQVTTYSQVASFPAPAIEAAATVTPIARGRSAGVFAQREGERPPAANWPQVDLAECTAYDPFAIPDSFAAKEEDPAEPSLSENEQRRAIELAKARAAREQAISAMLEAGVRAIVKGSDDGMAIVGTETLRVGQEINGYQVLSIESDGIILQPVAER